MNITDSGEAYELAIEICGCANDDQRKRDIAAILAYGEANRLRGHNAGLEAAAALVESGMFNSHGRAQPALAAKIRALAGETE